MRSSLLGRRAGAASSKNSKQQEHNNKQMIRKNARVDARKFHSKLARVDARGFRLIKIVGHEFGSVKFFKSIVPQGDT